MLLKGACILIPLLFLCTSCALDSEIKSQDERISSESNGTTNLEFNVGKSEVRGVYDDETSINTTSFAILANESSSNSISERSNSSSMSNSTSYVSCLVNKSYFGQPVEIINASKLATLVHVVFSEPNMTFRQIPGNCVVVMFYSPSCPFSCMAAPHFNALPRHFPDLKIVAFDAIKYRSISAQFGIIGTPTLILFHNRKPVAKFNDTSEYGLELFSSFITKYTGIQPEGQLVVTSSDFNGPISSVPVEESDFCLKLSLFVIGAHFLYFFYCSAWGRNLMDATLNAWREAEAQHHQNNHHPHGD